MAEIEFSDRLIILAMAKFEFSDRLIILAMAEIRFQRWLKSMIMTLIPRHICQHL